jgi:hypothetical protein
MKKKTVKKITLFILLTFLVLTGSSAFASKPEVNAVYNPDTKQITVTWKGNTYNNAVICVPKYQLEAGGVAQRGYDSFPTGGNESGSRTFKVRGEYIHPTSNEVGVYLSVTGTSFGGSYSNISKVSIDNAPEHTGYTGEGATGEIRDETNPFLAVLAMVVKALTAGINAVANAMGMGEIKEIIFAVNSGADSFTQPAPYSSEQWQKMDSLYGSMILLTLALGLILILVTAYKFIYAGVNKRPEVRAEASESLWRWILVLLIIAAAPVVVRALFAINNALTSFIAGIIQAENISTSFNDLQTGNVLITALVEFMFAWNRLFIGLIFFIRNWIVWTIYIFTPIMALLWGINKNVTAAAIWLGEMLSNAFLQTAYAFAFMVVALFISTGSGSVDTAGVAPSWAATLIGVYMIPSLANILRNSLQGLWTRWAGFDEEGLARQLGRGIVFASAGVAGVKTLAGATVGGAGRAISKRTTTPQPPSGGGGGGDSMALDGSPVSGGSQIASQIGQNSSSGIGETASGLAGQAGTAGAVLTGTNVAQRTGANQAPVSGQTASQIGHGNSSEISGFGLTEQDGTAGVNSQRGVLPQPQPQPFNPLNERMIKALNVGRKTGNAAAKVVGTIGGVGAGLVPGGQLIVNGMARVAGGIGRFAGTTAGLASQAVGHAKQNKDLSPQGVVSSLGTVMREGTGVENTGKAAAATLATTTMDAVSPWATETFWGNKTAQRESSGTSLGKSSFSGMSAREDDFSGTSTSFAPSFDGGKVNSLDNFRFR